MVGTAKRFTKEHKIKEIQKSLHKRARIKKQYLKSLKVEGYELPDKQEKPKLSYDQVKTDKRSKVAQNEELKKRCKRLQSKELEERRQHNFAKIQEAKERQFAREKRSLRVTKRTRSGQPLMGPKIDDLLEKIKNDNTYTS
ncbi:Fyv7p Ecym_1524 [Eremothecium cymbalariae DBVPG|uniref:rRNA-processing protein FYV7 n=1 Tax=Eremothecium cymbalariae (strain CBS 270.75 / DBVPG 7215 / KCTC 17166 / NRRL Y-17582) TaxID=931890 RepID=G8JMT0_ERECY|nr:hypothetical protein Ecym_1524 [Eremothecium cymbalariae DBVPG\